jgi:hypothetical protein
MQVKNRFTHAPMSTKKICTTMTVKTPECDYSYEELASPATKQYREIEKERFIVKYIYTFDVPRSKATEAYENMLNHIRLYIHYNYDPYSDDGSEDRDYLRLKCISELSEMQVMFR